MAGAGPFPAATLFLYLMTISQLHFTTSKPTGFSIKLIPRDSPESPIYPGNLTQLERIDRLIKFSKARAQYIESTSTSNATVSHNNIRFTLLRDNFFYMVQVGIGSQNTEVYLYVDTGGGLVWTQCEPCKNCYKQQFSLYDSQTSTSYRKLTCDHPLCQGDVFQCVNGECVYNVNYGGGAITRGVASFETFSLAIDNANTKPFENIIFGCSNDNQNIQFAKNGVISGILGLSMSVDSLVTQMFDVINRKFSYCLVPFTEAMQAPSVLSFGEDIPQPSSKLLSTKFTIPLGSHYYYLNLLDISVGFRRLGLAPDIFKIRRDGTGGCIIDSGALISQIDQNTIGRNAYRVVMVAFQAYYTNLLHFERITRSVPEGFQLCYKTPQGDFRDYVAMTYHFEGADYTIDGKYVNFFNNEQGYFCVALVPGNTMTILGAWHQQNMRIIYNANVGSLQFTTETCAHDKT